MQILSFLIYLSSARIHLSPLMQLLNEAANFSQCGIGASSSWPLCPFMGPKEGKTFWGTQLRIHLSNLKNDHNHFGKLFCCCCLFCFFFFFLQWKLWINSMLYPWPPPHPPKFPSPFLLCGFPTAYTFFFFSFSFLFPPRLLRRVGGRAGRARREGVREGRVLLRGHVNRETSPRVYLPVCSVSALSIIPTEETAAPSHAICRVMEKYK